MPAKKKTPSAAKPKKTAAKKAAPKTRIAAPAAEETARLISSKIVWESPLFRIHHDRVVEPGGVTGERDIIRHNGSVVILAVDGSTHKKNPWIVMERQYRHAAGQYLWELPAGKIEAGEDPVEGGKRELAEETGYAAKKWKHLTDFYPSPGFLGEAMKIFLAEGLVAGDAHPEEDEKIEIRLVRLSEVLKWIDKGRIIDGKTLIGVQLYARKLGYKHKK